MPKRKLTSAEVSSASNKSRVGGDVDDLSHELAVEVLIANSYDHDVLKLGVGNTTFRRYYGKSQSKHRQHVGKALLILQQWKAAGSIPGNALRCIQMRPNRRRIEAGLRRWGIRIRDEQQSSAPIAAPAPVPAPISTISESTAVAPVREEALSFSCSIAADDDADGYVTELSSDSGDADSCHSSHVDNGDMSVLSTFSDGNHACETHAVEVEDADTSAARASVIITANNDDNFHQETQHDRCEEEAAAENRLVLEEQTCQQEYQQHSAAGVKFIPQQLTDDTAAHHSDPLHVVTFDAMPVSLDSNDEHSSSSSGVNSDSTSDSDPESGAFTKEKRTFQQLLSDWKAECGVSRAAMDKLLKGMHREQPEVDYRKLPKSARTLERLGQQLSGSFENFRVRRMTTVKDKKWNEQLTGGGARRGSRRAPTDTGWESSSDDSCDDDPFNNAGSATGRRQKKCTGSYLHLGLEKALLCKSPGLYHFFDHIAMLRRAEAHSPGLLPEKYLELAFGKDLETARSLHDKGLKLPAAYFWYEPQVQRPSSLLFTLNMHVDGVQVFDNSDKTEVMPILASIHEIIPFDAETGCANFSKAVMIPIKFSKPFIVGVFYGDGKPDLNEYFEDVICEMNALSPARRETGRHCFVGLRLVLGDCPVRAWITGTCGHGGYFACQRCKIKGTMVKIPRRAGQRSSTRTRGVMKYVHTGREERRTNQEYDTYWYQEGPNQVLPVPGTGHLRNNKSPFHRLLKFKRMVTGIPIDLMHTGHAGALRQGIQLLTGVDLGPLSDRVTHKWSKEQVEIVDAILTMWKSCVPKEFNRKPRSLLLLQKWKMRECYVTGARLLPVLMSLEEHFHAEKEQELDFWGSMSEEQKTYFTNFMFLVVGLRIVSSYSMQPIQRDRLVTASWAFRQYLDFLKSDRQEALTLVAHLCMHLCDDAHEFQTHLGSISCYPFENFERVFTQLMTPAGDPLTVLLNKLVQRFAKTRESVKKKMNSDEFIGEIKLVRQYKSMEVPPNTIRKFYRHGNYAKLECAGFLLTNHFPNNIAVVKDNVHAWGYGIIWVTDIITSAIPSSASRAAAAVPAPGGVTIIGHKFLLMDNLTCTPVESHTYGVVKVESLCRESALFDMSVVQAKGMALPLDPLAGPGPITGPHRKFDHRCRIMSNGPVEMFVTKISGSGDTAPKGQPQVSSVSDKSRKRHGKWEQSSSYEPKRGRREHEKKSKKSKKRSRSPSQHKHRKGRKHSRGRSRSRRSKHSKRHRHDTSSSSSSSSSSWSSCSSSSSDKSPAPSAVEKRRSVQPHGASSSPSKCEAVNVERLDTESPIQRAKEEKEEGNLEGKADDDLSAVSKVPDVGRSKSRNDFYRSLFGVTASAMHDVFLQTIATMENAVENTTNENVKTNLKQRIADMQKLVTTHNHNIGFEEAASGSAEAAGPCTIATQTPALMLHRPVTLLDTAQYFSECVKFAEDVESYVQATTLGSFSTLYNRMRRSLPVWQTVEREFRNQIDMSVMGYLFTTYMKDLTKDLPGFGSHRSP